ncbi:MAG: aquaporin family protein [Candidatus Planktophila sp.]|nr:aquaporin family protein [Candidatus Planktophila sp.]
MKLRRVGSEVFGSAVLVMTVIGSGEMAENLSSDTGVQLLINSLSTAAILYALITLLADISGAHFNPLVTLVLAYKREMSIAETARFIIAQFVGALIGAGLANLVFDLAVFTASTKVRSGGHLFLSEIIATAGLIFIIFAAIDQKRDKKIPTLVACWIGAAYFFTSSTSFANPTVTFARGWSDTFAGIAPKSIAPFIAAQLIGAVLGLALSQSLSVKGKGKE